jgi:hypothetical protein
MDPYAYVGGNPETENDPTGHGPIGLLAALVALGPPKVGLAVLGITVIIIWKSPAPHHPSSSANSPQPEPAPTPNVSTPTPNEPEPTPEPAPSTDTNGAMCKTYRCYDLSKDEGKTFQRPDGSLATSHTISTHVNVSDADLRARVSKSNTQGGKGSTSKFNDLDTANWAVQYALDNVQAEALIEKLKAEAPGTTITFSVDTGVDIGYGYARKKPGEVVRSSIVTVTLMVGYQGNVYVYSAFPFMPKSETDSPVNLLPNSGGNGTSGGCSFSANTVVMTQKGLNPISQVQIGDQVLAYNVESQMTEMQPIIHVWTHLDNDLVDVIMENLSTTSQIHTTARHPFLTQEQGFVPAGMLQVGMHVLNGQGNTSVVVAVRHVLGVQTMYDLEVYHDHTFMVGTGEWIVHNKCEVG